MFGLTPTSLAKEGRRENLLEGQNVLTGAGLRISDHIRLSGGVVWFKEINNNPLKNSTNLSSTPFAAVSMDADVATFFQSIPV